MIGLVLAAGAGRRLRPYTDTLPKALVPIDPGTTVLDLTLANYAEVGITDVAIVVGYAAAAVEARVKDLEHRYGVSLELVHNDKAETWNNAYSLWCARDLLSRGVMLANGDTVHPASVATDPAGGPGRRSAAHPCPGHREIPCRRGDEGDLDARTPEYGRSPS